MIWATANTLVSCSTQVAKSGDPDAASKGLYALSRLLPSDDFRRCFFEAGELPMLQRLLAGHSTPPNVRRKALAMLADLAHYQVGHLSLTSS
jgi:hypothetical protein